MRISDWSSDVCSSDLQIAVVVGSLRKDSFNRKLANALVKLAPSEFTFKFLDIGALPLYNQDDDGNQADTVKRMKAEITASQGLLFVTPEYRSEARRVGKECGIK